jgi:predicted type IV restriction endonuclease
MDLADRLRELAARIPNQLQYIKTEEATKNALTMPFLAALGYNVFDPQEVTPELCADVGLKKGEKVDYAILKDGKPIMLLECKPVSANLDEVHASQLYRYFSCTEARVGILTNGLIYRFFSDLDSPNKMDARPFLEVNMLSLDDSAPAELKKFMKGTFEIDKILANASELRHTREIKKVLVQEMSQPSEELIRFFVSKVHHGRMTQGVRDQFSELIKRAMLQFISDRVSERLKAALQKEESESLQAPVDSAAAPGDKVEEIETTQEELQAFYIVQAILSQIVEPSRIKIRDQKSYCGVLLDDNNRKPICRFRFGATQKFLILFEADKSEQKCQIANLTEIFGFANRLKETIARYETKAA